MKYDDATWHCGGQFPADLPADAAATHTGMFLAWAVLNGLVSDDLLENRPELLLRLANRDITPGRFFLSACDGKFTDEDLSDEGNDFAAAYFDFDEGDYLADYESTLGAGLPDHPAALYYVADAWTSFDRLQPVLDARLAHWRAARDG